MIFDKNIQTLSTNALNWVAPIEGALDPQFMGIKGTESLFAYGNGEIRILKDEVDKNYGNRTIHKEILFVFGVHAIHELNYLYKTKNAETLIIVLEPNLSFFTHALNSLNLSIFSKENIYLFADSKLDNIITFLQPIIHEINYAKLMKKINFYFTSYYREYDFNMTKDLIALIRQTILSTVHSFGNDVEDSLIGLKHNLINLNYVLESKNTALLLNAYKDRPAIVVAAGPSLNKNIMYLKKAQGKALIIAVDTIINRLLKENIVPDFVCSIERLPQVYDYFYKNHKFPKEVTLVGPAVLDSRIFKEFEGNMIIPFRNEVAETDWLQRIMEQPTNSGIAMGSSCAHVAFGIANHLGCSPIILIGQDLAYGSNGTETHANGTFYDAEEPTPAQKQNQEYVEGYYGEQVLTTKIWLQFKTWFEKRIGESDLRVIDATEGGARIHLTEQNTLKESIELYCKREIPSIYDMLQNIEEYPINKETLQQNLKQEINYFQDFLENIINYFNRVEKMTITHDTIRKYHDQLNLMQYIVKDAMSNKIIMHNLQSSLLRYLWAHNSREQIISRENVQAEKDEQIKLLGVMARTIYEIKALVEQTLQELEEENDI